MERFDNDTLIKYYLQKSKRENFTEPLFYLKLSVASDSYLTINKETLYMMTSEKELLFDEFTYINKFTLNELNLIFLSGDDLIKDRKLFIIEVVQ